MAMQGGADWVASLRGFFVGESPAAVSADARITVGAGVLVVPALVDTFEDGLGAEAAVARGQLAGGFIDGAQGAARWKVEAHYSPRCGAISAADSVFEVFSLMTE